MFFEKGNKFLQNQKDVTHTHTHSQEKKTETEYTGILTKARVTNRTDEVAILTINNF